MFSTLWPNTETVIALAGPSVRTIPIEINKDKLTRLFVHVL